MLTKYRSTVDRLHDYLCSNPDHPLIQVHHSHIDKEALFKSRLISWIYISAVYLWALWQMPSITTNFIYLTMQGYFITWLFYTAVLQDYWLVKIYGKQNHPCKKFRHYIEIIYETALCFEVPITLVFWGFLFSILIKNGATTQVIIINTNLHLGPLVCLIVELYYNNFTFPKRHFWVLSFYGTSYLLINLVYSLTVSVIYQPIDWKSLLSYLIVIGSYVITFGAHHFAGYTFRRWKAHKLKDRITEGLVEEIEPKPISSQSSQKRGMEGLIIQSSKKDRPPTNDKDILL